MLLRATPVEEKTSAATTRCERKEVALRCGGDGCV
jgi:hypothetical protein